MLPRFEHFKTLICNSLIFTAILKFMCDSTTINFSIFLLAKNLGCVHFFFVLQTVLLRTFSRVSKNGITELKGMQRFSSAR